MKPYEEFENREVVWLFDRRHYAFLVWRQAYYSKVTWIENDEWVTEVIENDGYEFWRERAIDFESEG